MRLQELSLFRCLIGILRRARTLAQIRRPKPPLHRYRCPHDRPRINCHGGTESRRLLPGNPLRSRVRNSEVWYYSEAIEYRKEMAAGCAFLEIGHRRCVQHCAFEGFDRADIRFCHARAHAEADSLATEVHATVRCNLPKFDEFVDHRRTENGNVKCLVGIDPSFQDGNTSNSATSVWPVAAVEVVAEKTVSSIFTRPRLGWFIGGSTMPTGRAYSAPIACSTSGPEVAHQIINTGATRIRYLALSTLSQIPSSERPQCGNDLSGAPFRSPAVTIVVSALCR